MTLGIEDNYENADDHEIKLSIVVPTKNRHFYLEFLVNYFKSIDSNEIELIVYDNSSFELRQNFISFLNNIDDERIKYYQDDRVLSQTQNCDLAVSKSCGEYIILLGDDDIFSKHILTYIEKWREDQIEAILPIKGTYIWPDVKPRLYGNKQSGMFKVGLFTNKIVKIESKRVLRKVLNTGGSDILNLPRVYHGIVSNKVLNKIFEDCGSYFPGPSPDIANAIAICKYVKNYIVIDTPLIISGQCIKSAGGQGAEGKHYGEISKIKQLQNNTAKEWSKKVPFYWSGLTIYAESVSKALKKMKMDEYFEKFNYEYLYASCLVFDTNYINVIKNCAKDNTSFFKRFKIFFYFISIWFRRLFFHFKNNLIIIIPKILRPKLMNIFKQNIFEVAIINDNMIVSKKN